MRAPEFLPPTEVIPMTKISARVRNAIPDAKFAFAAQEKEPLENATHVRNAVARFNQVKGVTDAERDAAWRRILAAARKFGVEIHEAGWRELKKPRKSRAQ
jgi:hypothetical protein